MKINNFIVPALAVFGLMLIAFSVWGPKKNHVSTTRQSFQIATVLDKTGQVILSNNQMPTETEVRNKQELSELDTIRTRDESEVLIEFKTGGQLRLSSNTEVLLDRLENNNPLVVVKAGEIFVEKLADETPFWIRTEGQQYSAADYVLIDKKNSLRLQPDSQLKTHSKAQLTQSEIETTLNSKKSDFFKCYGQLIQKKPQSTGQVLISFTVENTGRLNEVEVSRSDIQDQAFKSCLTEVVSRVRFRAFSGSAITTVFPLKFE